MSTVVVQWFLSWACGSQDFIRDSQLSDWGAIWSQAGEEQLRTYETYGCCDRQSFFCAKLVGIKHLYFALASFIIAFYIILCNRKVPFLYIPKRQPPSTLFVQYNFNWYCVLAFPCMYFCRSISKRLAMTIKHPFNVWGLLLYEFKRWYQTKIKMPKPNISWPPWVFTDCKCSLNFYPGLFEVPPTHPPLSIWGLMI